MKKFICIHGHFYQPPRENPWTGEVELQESAAPDHDWNARIAKECYAPNTDTKILNNNDQAIRTVNNYTQISFNFGPTLLSWMEKHASQTYHAILSADRESVHRFSGHGAAIAQAYNHMILPLANLRDKHTQVIWGIKDFEYRFKRKPEGMWLPETAVDVETLEVLAAHGIAYTILAPSQAKAVAEIGHGDWEDVEDGSIDTQLTYLCWLPSGRKIAVFFYNGPISNEVAFGDMLKDGVKFAKAMVRQYPKPLGVPRLANVANDGETYGHHHNFGNMALAYMLHHIESHRLARVTIYGEFLEKNPPTHEVRIKENTSWSCYHGVERWKANCGCRLNPDKKWHQEWRKYLRETLDWLRDKLVTFYEQSTSVYFDDPWQIRDQYINVILNPSENNYNYSIWSNAKTEISEDDKRKIMNLLEMQRNAMLMYTSCGWFFDDISGIESIQILQYAARAMELAKISGGEDLEEEFLGRIASAESNIPEMENGRTIYNLYVKPAKEAAGRKNNV